MRRKLLSTNTAQEERVKNDEGNSEHWSKDSNDLNVRRGESVRSEKQDVDPKDGAIETHPKEVELALLLN
jgi:hypothetical protein